MAYTQAQMPLYFARADSIKVKSISSYLQNPWAGGLNTPQFSEIDLNFDGIKDLFVFDGSGNKISCFINQGTAGTIDYRHAPAYQNYFPNLTNWIFLADFNCDDKEDIFSHSNGAIAIYRNDGNAIDGLKFTKITSALLSDYLTDTFPITVSTVSLPAISDVDNDGDLDILNFRTSSIYLEYHKNRSMELYGNCDSLDFILTANCWGYFSENSISNDVNLNDTCSDDIAPPIPPKGGENNISFKEAAGGHSGSTILSIDIDGDIDKDILIGDISFKNMVMLSNGGNNQDAYISSQESNFPAYDTAINLTVFPSAYYLDVNNDSVNDLLISPAASNISENANSVWYYNNQGSSSIPVFHLEQKNLFQDEMIEVGEGAYPVFFDYNSDGLLDLVIGNYGYYNNTGSYQSGLALYENTGTATNPEFELVTNDYVGIISLGLQNVIPAFGDMDNDGDSDLIIGNKDGALHYFENSAGSGNTASFGLTEAFYKNIDVGGFSSPFIIDINNDSKPDLIIGEQNGNLNYYENTGTSSSASFSNTNSFWGEVDVRQEGSILGYSMPCLFKVNGESHLLVGSESGDIYHYSDIDNNLSGKFTLVDTSLGNIYEGTRCGVNATDINYDGLPDLSIGNYNGGVSLFYGSNTSQIKTSFIKRKGIKISPNPANDYINVEFNNSGIQLSIYNQLGKEMYSSCCQMENKLQISTLHFPKGLYYLIVNDEQKGYYSYKFVVLH
jgi:hypothetical protein